MFDWPLMHEGKTLEFKRDLSSPKPLLKTLVAFANTAGGRLVIGIANPLDEEERLCSLIADRIAPRLVPNVELMTVEDKTLLVVEVFVSGSRPHWLKSEGAEAGIYVRLGSTNRQADAALISELRRSAEGVAFDEMPMPELGQDDLDLDAARRLFDGISLLDPQALRTLKLLTKYQGRWVPTKGAVLLFGKERTQHFSDAWVQCGRFVGGDKARIFDHIDIHDPLPVAVDGVMLFLKKHAMRGAEFSATRRKDVWSIPLVILREAVVNALVHADYSQRGAPIRVSFFDDRIEVESPGMLPGAITPANIERAGSKARNPLIVKTLRDFPVPPNFDLNEGVPMMFAEMAAARLYPPQYRQQAEAANESVTVTLLNLDRPTVWDEVSDWIDRNGPLANADLCRIADLDTLKASKLLKTWVGQNLLEPLPDRAKRNMAYTKPSQPSAQAGLLSEGSDNKPEGG